MFDEIKIGWGKIIPGALVGQDFRFFRWPEDDDTIFEITRMVQGLYKLTARGYGKPGFYGNGPVVVRSIDDVELVWLGGICG